MVLDVTSILIISPKILFYDLSGEKKKEKKLSIVNDFVRIAL